MGPTPLETFVAVAGQGRRVGVELLYLCPVHADKRPSLGVRERADGTLLVKCRAGCRTEDVLDTLGLEWSDLFPERTGSW